MSTVKVAITMDENVVKHLDQLVKKHLFENRSRAIEEAVSEKLARLEYSRLARECKKMDPEFERNMAEEGLSVEAEEWPKY
ncbi:MAG: ribbon-helix-helix domain-containing protein [Nitrospirota bacterium]